MDPEQQWQIQFLLKDQNGARDMRLMSVITLAFVNACGGGGWAKVD